jgi:hypothetical protein
MLTYTSKFPSKNVIYAIQLDIATKLNVTLIIGCTSISVGERTKISEYVDMQKNIIIEKEFFWNNFIIKK